MKLAIIGGAGVRVPLLVHGLISRGLPVDHVGLLDIDAARLDIIARLTRARVPDVELTTHAAVEDCVRGADFVVTSVRVGGLAARQHDESVALSHGLVGQETVGPAGFAMAVRTVPVLAAYAEQIARHAPDAWVVNFTNPVGIVTQAMRQAAPIKAVGICDTPTELCAHIAHVLGVPAAECAFDYVGLNHLGWVREVYHRGQPLLGRVWRDDALLEAIYTRPMFPAAWLASLQLLPTEYVYFYDFPDRAVASNRAAGTSRGAVVIGLTDRLFRDLAGGPADPVRVYEDYLAGRSASYMAIEAGAWNESSPAASPAQGSETGLTGYDRIAFDVMHAIVHNRRTVIPLDVPNDGNIPELTADDVVEVPCVVDANGPRALHVGRLPSQVRELVLRVKDYERRTIDAALTGDVQDLTRALAHNPLVPSAGIAADLLRELYI